MMNIFSVIFACCASLFLSGCFAFFGAAVEHSVKSVTPLAVSQIEGQLENGEETFSGQLVGTEVTINSDLGRVCEGHAVPQPMILSCNDGTAGSISLVRTDISRSSGGTGSGSLGGEKIALTFSDQSCGEDYTGFCQYAKLPMGRL